MTTALYKVTTAQGGAAHGGSGKWTLNRWRSVRGPLVPCHNGLHLVEAWQLPRWLVLDGVVWEVEAQGEVIDAEDKQVARKARVTRKVGTLDRRTLVTFAADCAARALPIFEKRHPKDDRPRKCLEALRGWLAGTVTLDELRRARYAAATAATAAYATAADAYATTAAAAAATAPAATAAARRGEQEWQGAHLLELLEATPPVIPHVERERR